MKKHSLLHYFLTNAPSHALLSVFLWIGSAELPVINSICPPHMHFPIISPHSYPKQRYIAFHKPRDAFAENEPPQSRMQGGQKE